ncbi:MAG: MlaE family lipid ABC transporter permease subunit [Deltaproteobacteria bacterium]|nr:MlaE family lipid ABC transporter permease subunit [Deltaproteobacteria bacterium]
MPQAPFEIVRRDDALVLTGELRMPDAASVWRRLRAEARSVSSPRLAIDLEQATIVDGAIMSLLVELRRELSSRGVACEIVGASERVVPLVKLYRADEAPIATKPSMRRGVLDAIGRAVLVAVDGLSRGLVFLGEMTSGVGHAIARPASANLKSVLVLAERAGIDGIPIVLLLNFLVGFVMGYQSAYQLRIYGANVYVADVVGISVTRELGPLITAVIMSGRSGASFAAEIGTMRVSEEIDALRTLGFSPARYLVLPRVIALALVAPVLTLLGDIVGVAGGAVVGVTSLDVGFGSYLAELQTAVFAKDVWTGLVKSVAFGIAIALIGCQQGFATSGGAAGVGRRTTTTVVMCFFTIVIIDTLLTVYFRMFSL